MSPKKRAAATKADSKGLQHVTVKASPERIARWRAAFDRAHAQDEDLDWSTWIRRALDEAARKLEA